MFGLSVQDKNESEKQTHCMFISYRQRCELPGKASPLRFGLFPLQIRFQFAVFFI